MTRYTKWNCVYVRQPCAKQGIVSTTFWTQQNPAVLINLFSHAICPFHAYFNIYLEFM